MAGGLSEEALVAKTQKEILKEAKGGGSKQTGEDGVHAPVEPVPDVEWVGETWGLFWPDIENEMDENKEDPAKYLKKHYPDPKAPKIPPAKETAVTREPIVPLECPEAAKPAKLATPPPAVKLRPKKEPAPKLASPPRLEVFEGPKDINNDNSKWGWMRAEDSSASKARFRLSIFW